MMRRCYASSQLDVSKLQNRAKGLIRQIYFNEATYKQLLEKFLSRYESDARQEDATENIKVNPTKPVYKNLSLLNSDAETNDSIGVNEVSKISTVPTPL